VDYSEKNNQTKLERAYSNARDIYELLYNKYAVELAKFGVTLTEYMTVSQNTTNIKMLDIIEKLNVDEDIYNKIKEYKNSEDLNKQFAQSDMLEALATSQNDKIISGGNTSTAITMGGDLKCRVAYIKNNLTNEPTKCEQEIYKVKSIFLEIDDLSYEMSIKSNHISIYSEGKRTYPIVRCYEDKFVIYKDDITLYGVPDDEETIVTDMNTGEKIIIENGMEL